MAVACGANLAGSRGAVLIQNAGLLNCGGVLRGWSSSTVFLFLYRSLRGDHRDRSTTTRPKGA